MAVSVTCPQCHGTGDWCSRCFGAGELERLDSRGGAANARSCSECGNDDGPYEHKGRDFCLDCLEETS